jgi:hypothetical protein
VTLPRLTVKTHPVSSRAKSGDPHDQSLPVKTSCLRLYLVSPHQVSLSRDNILPEVGDLMTASLSTLDFH